MTIIETAPASTDNNLSGEMANAIRALSMDAVQAANSGHPGMPMGMADAATVLFSKFLKFDAADPSWPDRDRFILSAGHGSMLLYSLLYLTGYDGVTIDELKNFRQMGAKTAGHPEFGHCPGVETTTGPLGQGISAAVGMAIAERMMNARYGDDLVDHYTYVVAGDGCLMEGISHEAIDLAGHLKLSKLIVLWDDNSISIDGATSLTTSMDQPARFKAAGWDVISVDGHDQDAVSDAIGQARSSNKPTLIACKTIIGFGAPNKQGTAATHGAPLGDDEIAATRQALQWPHQPFDVPRAVLDTWRFAGSRGAGERKAWQTRLDGTDRAVRNSFAQNLSGKLDADFDHQIDEAKRQLSQEAPKLATRQASQRALNIIANVQLNLAGGSADLTGSNLTRTEGQKPIAADDFSGSYIHYGVREHAMAAAMNGIAQHGGLIPYGGTFLVFADYCRPSIRLSALMKQRVIYVMTHDSIGLGEDGPTHQPVEQIASLRAMPNVSVFRPADAIETLEAWQCALQSSGTPSVLCLSRQGLPALRTTHNSDNLTGLGAYVLHEPEVPRDITLIATGSEVSLAIEAASDLAADGVHAAVVSMPCCELFAAQDNIYQQEVLGTAPRIAIEAAVRAGWDRWIGPDGTFIGMEGFGASAPANELYLEFGITKQAIIAAARSAVS